VDFSLELLLAVWKQEHLDVRVAAAGDILDWKVSSLENLSKYKNNLKYLTTFLTM
jgi:hypothetical protein